MKTYQEIKKLNWQNYGIEDMHDFKFEIEKLTDEYIIIHNKKLINKRYIYPVNSLYELSKIEIRKEFLVLSDSVNSARGYNWSEDIINNGFDSKQEPIYEYFSNIFKTKIQDFMREKENIFMPCF